MPPVVKRTTCSMCTDHCFLDAHIENGKVISVEGNLCPRGRVIHRVAHHSCRLTTPLRRVGERGEGRFEPITWDQALDTIAESLLSVKERFGPESVVFYVGFPKEPRPWVQRLTHTFGSPNFLTESSTCYNATYVASMATYGYGIFAGQAANDIDPETRCLVFWGMNPSQSKWRWMKPILEQKRRGAKIIAIDPRESGIAQLADVHLRIIPGTDGALALAMGNVLVREGLYDKEFVQNYTHGFEQYCNLVSDYPPKRVEGMVGVPASEIIRAAHIYADGPSQLIPSIATVVHTTNGVQTFRAIQILAGITGNYDRPGGNLVAPLPKRKDVSLGHLMNQLPPAVGSDRFPLWVKMSREGQAMRLPQQIETGEPYPIKALVGVAANYMMFPESERFARLIRNELEFVCFSDLFHTPTTRMGDIILPAATSLEYAAIVTKSWGRLFWRDAVIPAVGESRPDWFFVFELAKRLGLADYFWNGDYIKANDEILSASGYTVEELRKHPNGVRVDIDSSPFKYKRNGFNTPSGKMEIWSTLFEEEGLPPLPDYVEPLESRSKTPEVAVRYPLILTSGARVGVYTHSQHRNIPELRRIVPEPILEMNPADAQIRAINPGDTVIIESRKGKITMKAIVTDKIRPGVVNAPHGWEQANVNDLVSLDWLDPISGFPSFKHVLAEVKKA